jgi:orotidine-5'-phosphate decarboxylase
LQAKDRIYCALDTPDLAAACDLAAALAGQVGGMKLGLEFFAACGPVGFRRVAETGMPIFLDLKLHDIPNTVASAVAALMPLAPAIMTVHTGGGPAMMRAAADAAAESAERAGVARPAMIGVTILTSLDDSDLKSMGMDSPVAEQALRLAALARDNGLDGIVCSPREVAAIRGECGEDFRLVVPGIRPEGASADDQKRVMTPRQAVSAGADILVIGRPITRADDPVAAAAAIAQSLD